jgi:2'-5' RNA ligase
MSNKQFLALEIEHRAPSVKFIEDNKHLLPSATWTPEDKLHITLRFFNTGPRPDDVKRLMDYAAAEYAPFDMHIRGMNTFGNRILWASPHPASAIQALGGKLGNPRFRPHLTLAKLEDGTTSNVISDIVEANPTTDFGTMRAQTVSLFKTLGSGQPHVKLYSIHLHGDPVDAF